MSVVRRHDPPDVAPPTGYHHVTVHPVGEGLKRVVLAGQVARRPDGTIPGDLAGQLAQAWANILACLASEGLGPDDLVKIVTYTTVPGPEALAEARAARAVAVGTVNPSATYLVVAGLAHEGYLVEIDAEAVGPA